ncbi:hypothetical protein F0919_15650 [Taibaiella lutea]|uniref:Uncharacterized protein n=1 Tax=Taibaiella lutea TaxID=2608001 RepID=A0A5M6CED3_9BACT|nr:hypothetical protein [Taibaiella lutea]KAA5532232.1 hypothetical protein F0919_15650 [Taibaiella lutea]
MAQLDTLKEKLLQILSKYPIDSYKGDVPMSVTLKRYILEIEFLRNETITLKKLGLAAMESWSVSLDDVQKVINDTIHEHFRLD